jgi:hypothetical protein
MIQSRASSRAFEHILVEPTTDAEMIQKMYRENAEDAKDSGASAFNRLREAIVATLEALAAGKITAKELPIATDQGQRTDKIRMAPGFDVAKYPAGGTLPIGAYTANGLAKFLGEVKERGEYSDDFRATFNALELLATDNGLEEKDVAGLEVWKIDAVVYQAKKNKAAADQAAKEATERAERELEALQKRQEEAARRAEADRIEAEKRAKKLKDDAAKAEAERKAAEIRRAADKAARTGQAHPIRQVPTKLFLTPSYR